MFCIVANILNAKLNYFVKNILNSLTKDSIVLEKLIRPLVLAISPFSFVFHDKCWVTVTLSYNAYFILLFSIFLQCLVTTLSGKNACIALVYQQKPLIFIKIIQLNNISNNFNLKNLVLLMICFLIYVSFLIFCIFHNYSYFSLHLPLINRN